MTVPDELPLFPLNVVLFPGMPLPLHIFEERYKQMIAHCIRTHTPFGVVLIRESAEVDGSAEPFGVGTTAHITAAESLPAGDYHLTTVGVDRFRIERIERRLPYLVGRVRPYPLLEDVPPASPLTATLAALLERYLDRLAACVGQERPAATTPTEPPVLACLAGIALQLPPRDKQRLLEIASVAQLLESETAVLRRELRLFDFMLDSNACPIVSGPFLAN